MAMAFLTLSAGCGLTRAAEESTAKAQEESVTGEDADTAVKDVPETEVGTDIEEVDEQDPEVETKEPQMSADAADVENNFGYFVKIGDDVYYRVQGATVFHSSIWGEFLGAPDFYSTIENDPDSGSVIMKYNTKTKETTEVSQDYGYGPIGSDGVNLYLTERNGDHAFVKYLSLDGSKEGKIADGTLVGCDAVKSYLAITDWEDDPYMSTLSLYHGSELLKQFRTDEGYEYLGTTSEGVFYYVLEDETENYGVHLYQMTEGETCDLGSAGTIEYGYPCAEQFLSTASGVYAVLSGREGTGMFVADAKIIKAVPNEQDSVSLVKIPQSFYETEGEMPVPVLYTDEAGALQIAKIAPHSAMLGSFEEGGDLLFAKEADEYISLADGFRLEPAEGAGEDVRYIGQCAEYLDGDLYLIVALAERDPSEDIGWREAYRPLSMEYIHFETETGKETVLDLVTCR